MNDSDLRRETIAFCQLLSVSLRSGRPLPEALGQMHGLTPVSKASQWAQTLASRLAEGQPLPAICQEISGFDPVLARLMPLLGDNRLIKVLELYTGFLVNLERMRENMKSAFFYPSVVLGLLLANLIQLNFGLFMQVYDVAGGNDSSMPIIVRLLYFAKPALWPVSLVIPIFLLISLLFMLRAMLAGSYDSRSLVARMARFSEALRLQEIGRLQGVISLYLRAGLPLARAVENAAQLAADQDAASLALVARALGNGDEPAKAFEFSNVLQLFGEGNPDATTLPDRMEYASESNYRHSCSMLRRVSSAMMLAALLLSGFFVLMITTGSFGSYYWAIWSI